MPAISRSNPTRRQTRSRCMSLRGGHSRRDMPCVGAINPLADRVHGRTRAGSAPAGAPEPGCPGPALAVLPPLAGTRQALLWCCAARMAAGAIL